MGSKYEDIYVEPDIEILRSRLDKNYLPIGKKILDIGCNHGTQLIRYYNKGWEVYGIDLNKKAIEDCKKYLPKENFGINTLDDAPFQDGSFDAIQTFHVLEHIYDPTQFLSQCRNLLKKDGKLEVRIPNG